MSLLQKLSRDQRAAMATQVRKTSQVSRVKATGGKMVRWYSRTRRGLMYIAGFGFLDAAAWQIDPIAGCAATGVSLFLLEALSGGEDE